MYAIYAYIGVGFGGQWGGSPMPVPLVVSGFEMFSFRIVDGVQSPVGRRRLRSVRSERGGAEEQGRLALHQAPRELRSAVHPRVGQRHPQRASHGGFARAGS